MALRKLGRNPRYRPRTPSPLYTPVSISSMPVATPSPGAFPPPATGAAGSKQRVREAEGRGAAYSEPAVLCGRGRGGRRPAGHRCWRQCHRPGAPASWAPGSHCSGTCSSESAERERERERERASSPTVSVTHLIHSQVDASIGDNTDETGGESPVEGSWPLSLQDLPAAVSHAIVLPSAAQSQPCLQHLYTQQSRKEHLL